MESAAGLLDLLTGLGEVVDPDADMVQPDIVLAALVAGIAVGLGAQTLVKDLLSGVFIVLENQYGTGDVVRVAGGAGLGGGSADAGAILRWAGGVTNEEALSLGSDVPFCQLGGRALVEGVGEKLTPLDFEARDVTLVLADFRVDTAQCYRTFDDLVATGWTPSGHNHLEVAAGLVEPRLASSLAWARGHLADDARLASPLLDGIDDPVVGRVLRVLAGQLVEVGLGALGDQLGVAADLLQLEGMDTQLAAKLAEGGVKTRDDLADLAVDELAEALHMDPIDLRLRNANQPGTVALCGAKLSSARLEDCLRAVRDAIGWDEKRKNKRRDRGVGVAAAMHGSGSFAITGSNTSMAAIDLYESSGYETTAAWGRLAHDPRILSYEKRLDVRDHVAADELDREEMRVVREQLAELVDHLAHESRLARPRDGTRRGPGGARGNADRQGARADVGDDVRVRRDDRLAPDPAARVDDRSEADLGPVLDDDPGEPVLEALEQRVSDVVGHDHRAHGHERLRPDQHRTADVDERLVTDERVVAERERRPGVAPAAAADDDPCAGPGPLADIGAPATELRILYGGGGKPGHAPALVAEPEIDSVVGGGEIATFIRTYHPTVWERWSSRLADIFISYGEEAERRA